ncbi:MAG: transcriptional regulator [Lachnospiraceae bacterium]|nr:transcriptional regulator [Lachnospiraceae bacterium]MCI9284089.1 transcriptional regulator [Lachnospiraceae bacterium]
MKNIYEQWNLLQNIMDMLENQFGSSCEVVLHDLTKDYNHTIVDIRNGHLTGREIGGCGSNLGLEILRGNSVNGNRYNYITHTRDGKILRSSSIYLRDDKDNVVGSLCVNLDITETIRFEEYLKNYNHYELENNEGHQEQENEIFAQNVGQLFDYLFQDGVKKLGKAPEEMNREEKMELLRYLDKKGAFLISKSGVRACELLQISKFTLYNYLDAIREE